MPLVARSSRWTIPARFELQNSSVASEVCDAVGVFKACSRSHVATVPSLLNTPFE